MMLNSKLLTITTVTVLLLKVKFISNQEVCVVDLCSCTYWFVEQPSNTFMCDPYESAANSFSTRCMVEHTVGDGSSLEIEWYYKESPDGPARLLTSSDATIQTTANCGLLKSVLTLSLVGSVDNQGNRFYFCRVNLNGKRLNDSQEFKLFSPEIISGMQPACTINQTTQSELKRRCIAPMMMTAGDPPKPMPTTTRPRQPATTNIISLSTSLHIMPTTSPPAITTESTDDETTSTNAPTTTTNKSEPDDNGGNDHESDGTDVGLSSEELTLIYVCIGVAAGFLILVISVLVVCVCVWNRFDTEFHHS